MTKLNKEKASRLVYAIMVIFALWFVFVLSIFPIEDGDTWMHLKYGEQISQIRSIPKTDNYSYTVNGTKDIDFEWLSQVIFYQTYKITGLDGLVLVNGLLIVLSFAVLLKTAYVLFGRSHLSVALLAATAAFSSFVYAVRPGTFTFIFLAILINILFTVNKRGNWKKLYILPLIFVLWVNAHAGFIIGVGLLLLYSGYQIFAYALRNKLNVFAVIALPKNKIIILSVVTLLSVLACFINPYGIKTVSYIFGGLATHSKFLAQLNEWKSPFDPMHRYREYVAYYLLTLIIGALLFLFNFKRFNLYYFLVFVYFVIASLTGVRNLAVYFIGAYIPLLYCLKEFANSFKKTNFQNNYLTPALQTSAAIVIIALSFVYLRQGNLLGLNYHYFRIGANDSVFPGKAVDFINEIGLSGNMLNEYGLGCYLIWKSPARKVFIDGRSGLYTQDFFFRYQSFGSDPAELAKAADAYDFNYIITQDARFLKNNSQWKLIYFDNLFKVYVRNADKNAEIIKQWGYDIINPNKDIEENYAGFNEANSIKYKNEILRALAQNYETVVAHAMLSEYYVRNGDNEKALEQLKKALETRPDLPYPYVEMGNYYAGQKQPDKAIAFYKKALKLDPRYAEVYFNLGNAFLQQNKYKNALNYYQKSFNLDNKFAPALLGMGYIYADNLSDKVKALSCLNEYLRLSPNAENKNDVLGKINELTNSI